MNNTYVSIHRRLAGLSIGRPIRIAILLGWLSLAMLGCGSMAKQGDTAEADPVLPAQRPVSEFIDPDASYRIDAYDPLERLNRTMYTFNARFDRAVFLPVVGAYETVTPIFVEDRVSDFFSNVSDLRNLLNALLQLKWKTSLNTSIRLVFNTTFGVLGLWDPATIEGFHQQREDFGQTLGHYGLNPGPYLVLPLLGPSTLRDASGLIADTAAFEAIDPFNFDDHGGRELGYRTLYAIDTRHRLDFRYYQTGSPFEYDLVRFLYLKHRRLEIAK